jgi:hypothetical protein
VLYNIGSTWQHPFVNILCRRHYTFSYATDIQSLWDTVSCAGYILFAAARSPLRMQLHQFESAF